MTANYNTRNVTNYINVKLVREPKFFPKKGDMPAATYLTFAHNTKGEDATIFIDARVVRGAEMFSKLRKGDIVNAVYGQLTFRVDNQGELRGMIFDAQLETTISLKDREAAPETPPPDTLPADEGVPAFE